MKLIIVLALCVAYNGQSSGTPFFSAITSAVSGGVNMARGLAVNTVNTGVNAAKATANAGVSVAKATANAGVTVAKGTVNAGVSAVKATANAGANVVKFISTGAVNTGVDLILATTRKMAGATGKALIQVPDIEQKFGPAKFTATQGFFSDLTTLVKDGNANVSMNGTSVVIDVPLKMNTIDLGYEQFNASMLFIKLGGGIHVHVQENQFVARIILKPGLSCTLNIERVTVSKLDGIDVDFINMGSTSETMLETVGNLIVAGLKGMIKEKVQEGVDSALKSAIKENGAICSKFMS